MHKVYVQEIENKSGINYMGDTSDVSYQEDDGIQTKLIPKFK